MSTSVQSQSVFSADYLGQTIYYQIISNISPYKVAVVPTSSCYSGELVIPDSVQNNGAYYMVTSIANGTFYNCSSLISVTLPATIDFVGDSVFWGNTNLRAIYCNSLIPPFSTPNIYDKNISNRDSLTLYVPCSSFEEYQSDTNNAWTRFLHLSGSANAAVFWDTICQNESYNLHGFYKYPNGNAISGIFDSTFVSDNGCAYSFTIHLHVKPAYRNNFYYYVCKTNNIHYHQNGFDVDGVTGTWTNTAFTHLGCDSSSTLHIILLSTDTTIVHGDVCQGNAFTNAHFSILPMETTVPGVLTECKTIPHNNTATTMYQAGCKQTEKLILNIHPTIDSVKNDTICKGDNKIWQPRGYLNNWGYWSGPYIHSYYLNNMPAGDTILIDTLFKTQYGCRNNYTLNLKINPVFDTIVFDTVCKGTRYTNYGQNFTATQSGMYSHTFHTTLGCDSIVRVNLMVNPTYRSTDTISICRGESYNFNGQNLTIAGTYIDTLQTAKGCDSIMVLKLNINPIIDDTLVVTKCEGVPYTWRPTGYYKDSSFSSIADSSAIRYYNNGWKTKYYYYPYHYKINTFIYDTLSAGNYTFVDSSLTTQYGCTNKHTLQLKINPVFDTIVFDTVCKGTRYTNYGQNFTAQST